MIFDSVEETLDYILELLKRDIVVSKKDFLKICSVNKVKISKSIFEHQYVDATQVARVTLLDDQSFSVIYYQNAWIKQLPELYHDNEFLSRFLFGFQQEYLETQSTLDTIADTFRPQKSEFIDWLASWVGVAFSDSVSEYAKRRLLQNIVKLYKIRGTKQYYVELIYHLTDIVVIIEDGLITKKVHNSLIKRAVSRRYFKIIVPDGKSSNKNMEKEMKNKIELMSVVVKQHKPANVEFSIYYQQKQQMLQATSKEKFVDMHSEDNGYEY